MDRLLLLKRAKTLAAQSANGTYDNDVDRHAIEVEFRQLGEELDHIADTDFNGVVMLNGRHMADGIKGFDDMGKLGNIFPDRIGMSNIRDNVSPNGATLTFTPNPALRNSMMDKELSVSFRTRQAAIMQLLSTHMPTDEK